MNTLPHFATPQLTLLHRGKVRDSYRIDDSTRLIIVSDRLSAFDSVLETAIPHKGAVLNGLANFWFEKTAHIIPNHVKALIDANVMLVKEAQPIKVEMVVRNYITGSMLRGYQKGQRTFSGVTVPDGLTKHQQFPTPIVTPTTKEESDREITPENLVSEGWVSQELYDKMAEKALELFKVGSDLLASQGIILVDTKYEFGLLNGELILIDEIHTPDSSRFWSAEDYARNPEGAEQMDKEYIRQWLIANKVEGQYPRALTPEVTAEATHRYLDIYQRIVGQPLATADETATGGNVANRLVSNLVKAGLMKDAWVSIVADSPADEKQGQKIRSSFDGYEVFTQLHVNSADEDDVMTEVWNRSIEPGVIIAVAGLGDALAARVNVPVISWQADAEQTTNSSAFTPGSAPTLLVAHPDNAVQAALRALNTLRLRERLRHEIAAAKTKRQAADV
ncbi:phosphoribosylaminoimidazolesuccinocarboxamide synthase [Hymenobacter sp. HMF4947]|uniref:Phosphoribosylaminoimidazole-succinocarboxamide synthase n=1 Tax=Hymenobacter ginkgonis TaxID=2682976 RepID=A0A7K1TDU4_9BACT|nr:phosphoribosylaminoimidazolesuccinocarboxamide synthase [Hymenobacter ginkgonis]MVN76331.1 phosphoribosylaminoimidazolesuccinocarboxamide synthase [Hymenobacter ginkgonis]